MLGLGTLVAGYSGMRLMLAWMAFGVALAVATACSHEPDHFAVRAVRITSATVVGDPVTSMKVDLGLDNCNAGSNLPYSVTARESAESVTVTVTGAVWTGQNQADCANGVRVTLRAPLGHRTVVDGATRRAVKVSIQARTN